MTLAARISRVVEPDWLKLDPIRVGSAPATVGTPDRCVIVADDDNSILRVNVYAYGPDCFAFQDALIWRDNLIIGFGSHVHAVSLSDRSVVTVPLEEYFCHLYPTESYLLLASGSRLFRMEHDRSILWRSEPLGLDGVIVHEPGPTVIRGDGEWDPPGGWQPFAVMSADGKLVS